MSRVKVAVAVLALLLGVVGVVAVPTTSGRLTGKVTNPTNTARSAVYPKACAAAARATGAYLVWPLDDAGPVLLGTTSRDVSSNGTRTGTYSSGGVSYRFAGTPCPRDNLAGAASLNGTSGSVHGPSTLLGLGSLTGPQVFSVQVWFRTDTTSGGKLAGFGSGTTAGSTSGSYDRHVYMTNNGRLVAGVAPGGTIHTATSTASYNDNTWHHAVATLGPVGTPTGGLRLYVDGALVASDTQASGAQVYNGLWRFGFDNLDTWPDRPTSRYFRGSLSYAAVWDSTLTPTQVIELSQAGR